jgi:hypothetical protein
MTDTYEDDILPIPSGGFKITLNGGSHQ